MPSFHESSTKYEGINNNSQVRKHAFTSYEPTIKICEGG